MTGQELAELELLHMWRKRAPGRRSYRLRADATRGNARDPSRQRRLPRPNEVRSLLGPRLGPADSGPQQHRRPGPGGADGVVARPSAPSERHQVYKTATSAQGSAELRASKADMVGLSACLRLPCIVVHGSRHVAASAGEAPLQLGFSIRMIAASAASRGSADEPARHTIRAFSGQIRPGGGRRSMSRTSGPCFRPPP